MRVEDDAILAAYREAATTCVTQSGLPSSIAYAAAREIWGLWWARRDAIVSGKLPKQRLMTVLPPQESHMLVFEDDEDEPETEM